MTEFHKGDQPRNGDRVRVQGRAFEGTLQDWNGTIGTVVEDGGETRSFKVPFCTVEVLERADDPSKDPRGLVREFKSGVPAVCYGRDYWVYFGSGSGAGYGIAKDRELIGCRVIGSVPGTPAAAIESAVVDAASLFPPPVGTAREPRLFQSDGPEPPRDVEALAWLEFHDDTQYQFLRRVGNGWLWSEAADKLTPDRNVAPNDWRGAVAGCPGQYREVLS